MVLRLPLLHTAIRIESAPGGWGGADGMREAAVRKAGIQQEHAVAAACATCTPKRCGEGFMRDSSGRTLEHKTRQHEGATSGPAKRLGTQGHPKPGRSHAQATLLTQRLADSSASTRLNRLCALYQ